MLGQEKALVEHSLTRLEGASGESNIDVKLIAEIIKRSHLKYKQLGLDPKDTTADELYQALINLVALHDKFLAKQFNIEAGESIETSLTKIKAAALKLYGRKSVWSLRHNVAKKLISQTPPQGVMSALGYRSVDSMLKREPVEHILAGVRIFEDGAWQKQFFSSYSSLQPSDFESRVVNVTQPEASRWLKGSNNFISTRRHNIVKVEELGTVVILPLEEASFDGLTITFLSLILQYLAEVRAYSSYAKLKQVQSNFGQLIADSLVNQSLEPVKVAGQAFHWDIVHKFFGSSERQGESDLFGPQIQPDDLLHEPFEQTLFKVEPALHFWSDVSYVGVAYDDTVVSLNLLDVALNYLNHSNLAESSTDFLARSLWQELAFRYLENGSVQDQLAHQFESSSDNELANDISGEVFA